MDNNTTRGSVIVSDAKRQVLSHQEEQVVLDVVNALMSTLGKFQQYPTINQVILDAMDEANKKLSKWLRTHKRLEFVAVQGNLQVNNSILSMISQQKDFVQAFLFYLTERNVRTFIVKSGVKSEELQRFYEFFSKSAKEIVAKKNLSRALKRKGVRHINLSSELIMEGVVVKTEIGDELTRKLSQLNVDDLLEKANVLSQLDMNTLHKVGDLATMVANLNYTKHEEMSEKIIHRLAETLHGDNAQQRLTSARAFSQIADKAADYTLYGLHSEVGGLMADQISQEEDPQVFSALAKGLEKSAQVHIAKGEYDKAMKIVASLGVDEISPQPKPDPLRQRAASAISNIADPATVKKLVSSLESNNSDTRVASVEMLCQVGRKAVSDLIDRIYTTEDEKVLNSAAEILMEIGQPALNELYAELGEDMDDRFRAIIIRVIGEAGDVHSVVKLMPFLAHENLEVAAAAFRSMLKIGGPAAENKVVENLASLKFPLDFFKERVVDFGNCESAIVVEPLLDYLDGKGTFAQYTDPEIEIQAVRSLRKIEGSRVVEGLSALLSAKKGFLGFGKGREQLEVAVCNALGRLGDRSAEKALNKAKKSKHKPVRFAAEQALKTLAKTKPTEETKVVTPTASKTPAEQKVVDPDAPTMFGQAVTAEEQETPVQLDADESAAIKIPSAEKAKTMTMDEQTMFESPGQKAVVAGSAPAEGNEVRILLVVGPVVVDDVLVRIPGVNDEGKITSGQKGAQFDLRPGEYEIMIQDQGLEVSKQIVVGDGQRELRIDLQDIFNF